MEVRSGHSRHLDVRDQASCVTPMIGVQESFGAVEDKSPITMRLQEAFHGPAYRFVVVDDCNEEFGLQFESLSVAPTYREPSMP